LLGFSIINPSLAAALFNSLSADTKITGDKLLAMQMSFTAQPDAN
jgi:hypothetical protein